MTTGSSTSAVGGSPGSLSAFRLLRRICGEISGGERLVKAWTVLVDLRHTSRRPVVAVEEAVFCGFSKDVVGAFLASTGPAASTGGRCRPKPELARVDIRITGRSRLQKDQVFGPRCDGSPNVRPTDSAEDPAFRVA